HRTALEERWGGWYVTGTHGKQTHRGNLIGKVAFEKQERTPNYLGNLADLGRFFEVSRYPERGSDIVALMVLEHQTHMDNFITRLNYESTLMLRQYGHVKYLKSITESFVRYLLFAEEAPLTAPVKGTSDFTKVFPVRGPRDRSGRSLRDFDLKTRLFAYPCSYLIYSEAFDALPEPARAGVYQRLYEILTDKETTKDYERLSPETKRAIREILADTKPGLPEYWKGSKQSVTQNSKTE